MEQQEQTTESLVELLNRVIPICNYKGVIVEKIANGYLVLNQKVKTPEEVDDVISESKLKLQERILQDSITYDTKD